LIIRQTQTALLYIQKGTVMRMLISCAFNLTVFLLAQSNPTLPNLPEGNIGIASHYPNDSGISEDSNVIFSDDFESYKNGSDLGTNWNGGVYHNCIIDTTKSNVFAGKKSLEFWAPRQTTELSNGVARELKKSEELDVLFLRYYSKFDRSFNITGSSHNGGGMSAHYFVNGNATPGVAANGTNKFLIEYEFWRGDSTEPKPGNLNIYIYHPEQRTNYGDHFFPDGTVLPWTYLPGNFGTEFLSRPNIVVESGKWYCYEVMLKANTPGMRDGRIGCWLDGKLVADFPNLRLRDIDTLKINRFGLSFHFGANPINETWKWYDNVVAAKSYIGPVSLPNKTLLNRKVNNVRNLSVSGKNITFTLVKPSVVSIDIYSMQGQTVVRLTDNIFSSGKHTVSLDACDRSGKRVCKGMYLVKIRCGEEIMETTAVRL
jgi:hypothetical protein